MKVFDWNMFKSSDKIAVHCKTEEEANDFCREMHEHGFKWRLGDDYLSKNNFLVYKSETCYYSDGMLGSIKYAKLDGHIILKWSDYIKNSNNNKERNFIDIDKLNEKLSTAIVKGNMQEMESVVELMKIIRSQTVITFRLGDLKLW